MVSYAKGGINLDVWQRNGGFDVVGRELAMSPQPINGEIVLGQSSAERDFWLAEHCDRIMDTVSGFAFTGLRSALPDSVCVTPKNHATPSYYKRETFQGTIERAKEIAERFTHYALTVQPFTLEYYEGMPEAELRAWAAGVVSALRD